MARRATVFRVLFASPSDLDDERTMIADILLEWNVVHGEALGAVLEPVRWETHATPELGDRPQALLNRQIVDKCDVLVASFWTRVGTPTGVAASGTIEEIEEFVRSGRRVLLYFATRPVPHDRIDPAQLAQLQEFKASCKARGIIEEYASIAELRQKLQRHLATTIRTLIEAQVGAAADEEDDVVRTSPDGAAVEEFVANLERFRREIGAKWNIEKRRDAMSLDDARMFGDHASDELVTMLADPLLDRYAAVKVMLEDAAGSFAALKDHEIYLDGGISRAEFWRSGDEAIALLDGVARVRRDAKKSAE